MTYLAAVIPTIDEAETIGDLVRALDKTADVVCVCDASPDERTRDAARDAGASVLTPFTIATQFGLPPAMSFGGSLGESYRHAHSLTMADWYVLHIDAGGSHDPIEVYPMLDLAREGFDVVIGSRFCPGGQHHGPWKRRVTSRWASAALNFISLQDISDWTSGYRIYSPRAREILAQHTFTTTGHAWQIESLWVLIQHGLRVVEHPIVYESSVSHLSSGRVREAAGLWWRLLWA